MTEEQHQTLKEIRSALRLICHFQVLRQGDWRYPETLFENRILSDYECTPEYERLTKMFRSDMDTLGFFSEEEKELSRKLDEPGSHTRKRPETPVVTLSEPPTRMSRLRKWLREIW